MPINKRSGKPGPSRSAAKPSASSGPARPSQKRPKPSGNPGPGRPGKRTRDGGPPASAPKAARDGGAPARPRSGAPSAPAPKPTRERSAPPRPRSGGSAAPAPKATRDGAAPARGRSGGPQAPVRPEKRTGSAPVAPSKPSAARAAAAPPAAKPAARRPQSGTRPGGKRAAGTVRPSNIIHTKWKDSREFMPAASPLYKGFFREETLEKATELLLVERDPLIQPAAKRMLGDTPVGALHFDLKWENANRFLYTVEASNRLASRATLGWMVARNHQEFGAVLRAGYDGLCQLNKAAPALASEPLGSGFVYLPDRYRRTELGRELPVYFFRWPAREAAPLCVASPSQLSLSAAPRPRLMGRAETERIRFGLTELVARGYRAEKGVGLNLPALSPDDFLGWRSEGGVANVNLVFCRAREVHSSPGRYLQRLLSTTWPAPGGTFSLVPEEPARFFAAVSAAVGDETARMWVAECCGLFAGRASRAEKGPGAGYVEALRELVSSTPEQKES